MSTGKRFEKTFSRKKKESDERKKEESDGDELVIALLSQYQKRKNPDNRNKSKTGNKGVEEPSSNNKKSPSKPNKEEDKKKVADSRKPKQKQQNQPKQNQGQDKNPKQKRNSENEEVKNTKKQKTMTAITKDGKNQGKEKVKEECSECTFPTNRIVRIVKNEGSDYRLSQEAIFLINKATEKFIELFSEDAYDCALQDKKSFVGYKHLSSSVGKEKRLDFLSDFVPEKVAVEKALAEWKPAETLPG